MIVRSPLGAIGGILVLIQGIAAGALFGVSSHPTLQFILVVLIVVVTIAVTILVIWLIIRLVRLNPAYLFNPQDIDPAIHRTLYACEIKKIGVELEPQNK